MKGHLTTTITLGAAALLTTQATAMTMIRVDVTTTGPVALAPAAAGFHNGSASLFTAGNGASAGLELLAELGGTGDIISEQAMAGFTNFQQIAPGGPFTPNGGNVGSAIFNVADNETGFSIAAMILPSNDWFTGNSSVIDVSSILNTAVGTSFSVDLLNAYDAGTELEDFAFSPGNGLVSVSTAATPPGGADQNGTVSLITGSDPFASFANIPAGFDTTNIDFTGGPIASVTFTVVPEPSSALLLGLGVLPLLRRKR